MIPMPPREAVLPRAPPVPPLMTPPLSLMIVTPDAMMPAPPAPPVPWLVPPPPRPPAPPEIVPALSKLPPVAVKRKPVPPVPPVPPNVCGRRVPTISTGAPGHHDATGVGAGTGAGNHRAVPASAPTAAIADAACVAPGATSAALQVYGVAQGGRHKSMGATATTARTDTAHGAISAHATGTACHRCACPSGTATGRGVAAAIAAGRPGTGRRHRHLPR